MRCRGSNQEIVERSMRGGLISTISLPFGSNQEIVESDVDPAPQVVHVNALKQSRDSRKSSVLISSIPKSVTLGRSNQEIVESASTPAR